MSNVTSFSIEMRTCPSTGKAFGGKYAGTFQIKRPSIGKRTEIDAKNKAKLMMRGYADPDQVSRGLGLYSYIHTYITECSINTKELPKWFDLDELIDLPDEEAILAVWEATNEWLDTFRPQDAGGTGGNAG